MTKESPKHGDVEHRVYGHARGEKCHTKESDIGGRGRLYSVSKNRA